MTKTSMWTLRGQSVGASAASVGSRSCVCVPTIKLNYTQRPRWWALSCWEGEAMPDRKQHLVSNRRLKVRGQVWGWYLLSSRECMVETGHISHYGFLIWTSSVHNVYKRWGRRWLWRHTETCTNKHTQAGRGTFDYKTQTDGTNKLQITFISGDIFKYSLTSCVHADEDASRQGLNWSAATFTCTYNTVG